MEGYVTAAAGVFASCPTVPRSTHCDIILTDGAVFPALPAQTVYLLLPRRVVQHIHLCGRKLRHISTNRKGSEELRCLWKLLACCLVNPRLRSGPLTLFNRLVVRCCKKG